MTSGGLAAVSSSAFAALYSAFGKYDVVHIHRQIKELTQEQLAEIVGVRRETIMRLEKAQYNPSLKLAIDISRAVNTPIEEIFVFK